MILSTIDIKEPYQVLDLLCVNHVQSSKLETDTLSVWKTLKGGDLPRYTALIDEMTATTLSKLQAAAAELGADGLIGVSVKVKSLFSGALLVTATGTAITLLKE